MSAPPSQLATKLDLRPLMYNGAPYQLLTTSTGFYGEAFVSTLHGTKQLVIAFQGTNPNPPSYDFGLAQGIDDAEIQIGAKAPAYATALSFTTNAMRIAKTQGIGKANDFITGHSLGAAEAEYVATKTGLSGVTFGTPGIVPAAGSPASGLHNYVEQGDPVGNYASNAPDYLSNGIANPSIVHYGQTTLVGPVIHSGVLLAANAAYGRGTVAGEAAAAGLVAGAAYLYHPLGTYATDLGLTIYSGDNTVGSDVLPVCYAAGTRIRTASGDVAIERLAVGDLVETADGASRPIRWLGKRRIDCRRHRYPHLVRPIRIAAHAFGQDHPTRDLLVSPGHAICFDVLGEVLIPAAALRDGTTITQDAADTVTYWHVELDAHDLVVAENLPAESYLECGNRGFFEDESVVALAALPERRADDHAGFCRPYHHAGPLVESVRRQVSLRARRLASQRRDGAKVG